MRFTVRIRLIGALLLALISPAFFATMPASAAPRLAPATPTPAPCVPVLGQHDVPATSFESSCLDEPGQIRPVDFAIAAVFKTAGKATVKFRSSAPLTIKSDPKQNAGVAIDANTWSPELEWEAKSSGKAIRIIPQAPVELVITSSVNPFTIKAVAAIDAPTPQPTASAAPTPAPNSLLQGSDVFQAVIDGDKLVQVLDGKKPLVLATGDSFELALINASKSVTVTVGTSAPQFTFNLTTTTGISASQVYSGTTDQALRINLPNASKMTVAAGSAKLHFTVQGPKGASDVLQVTVTRKQAPKPAPANAGAAQQPTSSAGSGLPQTGPADESGLGQPNQQQAPTPTIVPPAGGFRFSLGSAGLLLLVLILGAILLGLINGGARRPNG